MKYINQSIPRFDAVSKVDGSALYPGDYNLPGQLYMKIKFALRPHAIVKSIDIDEASQIPGVITILTAKDVPVNDYGLIMPDQPVLCGPGSAKAYVDRVRFVGDQIALVIAEDEDTASKARDLIQVEFEDLPVVTEQMDAIKTGSILLHPDKGSNEFCTYTIRRGDTEKAVQECDVVVENVYNTPVQEHA